MKRWGLILGPLLMVGVILIPWPEGPSPEARRTAGVTVLMAAWWVTEAIPIAVTALLPLALFPWFGILPSAKVAPAYANHLVFLFLGGFLLALSLERWGLHRRIALRVVQAVGTGPRRLTFGFMLATALLSMWVSNTATVLMMLPIAMAVVRRLSAGATRDGRSSPEITAEAAESLGLVLMLSLAYAAGIGGMGTLIGTPPNIVFAGMLHQIYPGAPEVGFLQWMEIGLPLVLVLLPLSFVVVQRVAPVVPLGEFRFEAGGAHIREELDALGPLGRAERLVATVFAATVLLWLTRSRLEIGSFVYPGWATLFPHPGYIHDATVAVTMCIVLFLVPSGTVGPDGRGERLLAWADARKGVPWGILLLFGGGFALAAAFQQSGLALWMGGRLSGLGQLPLPALILAVCLGVMFMTEVTSNTATATLLLPILASTAGAIHVHPLLLMVPATLSASCAFMLPVATPPNAIVFGSGWVTIPRMARTGVLLNLMAAVLITLLALGPLRAVFDTRSPAWVGSSRGGC